MRRCFVSRGAMVNHDDLRHEAERYQNLLTHASVRSIYRLHCSRLQKAPTALSDLLVRAIRATQVQSTLDIRT